jgi:Fe-S-cluster-containing dehydrogenase component
MMDYDRCIGCRYCEVACPYGARAFNWRSFTEPNPAVPAWGQPEVERRPRGVVEKCAFCYQRIDRGLALGLTPGVDKDATPACVVACPAKARLFGDLNDPESAVSIALAETPSYRLREDLGTGPRVYYLPARQVEQGEETQS